MKKYLALVLALAMVLSLGASFALADENEPPEDGTVLADDENVTVIVGEYEQLDWGGAFDLYVENKTDKELLFYLSDMSVNGMMCGGWGDQIEAGGKRTGQVVITEDEMTRSGINYVETIKGTIDVEDYDDYEDPLVCQVPLELTVPTDGKEGPAVSEPEFTSGFEPVEVLTGDLTFTVVDYDPDGSYDGLPVLTAYMKNDTEDTVTFMAMDFAVNGMVLSAGWGGQDVSSGCAAYSTFTLDSYGLNEAGIDSAAIHTIQMNVMAEDEDWETLASQTAVLTVAEGGEAPSADMKDFGHGFEPVEVLTGDVTVTVVDYDPAASYGDEIVPQMTFFLQNNTDKELYFGYGNMAVNGFDCSASWGQRLPAGLATYSVMTWWPEDLESAHVDTIQTVSFTVAARDDDTYEEVTSGSVELTLAEAGEAPAEGGEASAEQAGMDTVLLDDDTVLVTVTGCGSDDDGSQYVELLLENKTDEQLEISMNSVAVNGRVCDSWYEYVDGGSKRYSQIEFSAERLAQSGINYIETVAGALCIRSSDSYETLSTTDVSFTVPTDGAEGPAVSEPDYGHGFEPVTLMEADGLAVTAVDFDPHPGGEDSYYYDCPQLMLHAVNSTDSSVNFFLREATVNGTTCTPSWSVSLPAGMEAYSPCTWWSEELESAHVDEIYAVGFTVVAQNTENYTDLATAPAALTVAEGGEEASPAEGILLVEGSLARLTATDYDPEEFSFDILTENLSDQALQFSLEDTIVNGMAVDSYWSTTVQPGMRSYEELYWESDRMALNGINYIETVTATLKIYGGDGGYIGENTLEWTAPTDGMDGPAMGEPALSGEMEPVDVLTGSVHLSLVDYQPPMENEWGGMTSPRLIFFAENTGDGAAQVYIEDVTVDGLECYGTYNKLPAGTASYFPLSIYLDELDGATQVGTVSFSANVSVNGYTAESGSAEADVSGVGNAA